MRIYLSARWSRQAEMLAVRQRLEELGHEVTARWLDEPPPELQVGDWQRRVARHDLEDIADADTLLQFANGADGPDAWRGGRHVELGYALACKAEIVLIGKRENVFHHLGDVQVFGSLDAWLATLPPEEALPEHLGPDYEACREVMG